MARFSVVLTDSFLEALSALPDWARDETAVVIRALESSGDFDPDPAEYIIERGVRYKTRACESVREWGWKLFWYQEESGEIFVLAERSIREKLHPKKPV